MMAALAPGFLAIGAFMVVVPLLTRESTPARSLLTGVSFILLLRYFHWRVTKTVPPPG